MPDPMERYVQRMNGLKPHSTCVNARPATAARQRAKGASTRRERGHALNLSARTEGKAQTQVRGHIHAVTLLRCQPTLSMQSMLHGKDGPREKCVGFRGLEYLTARLGDRCE